VDSEGRYVWLNLDIDMVSIGDSWLHIFRPIAQMIKRLRFSRDNNDESWCSLGEAEELRHYKNVSEIHVVVSENGDMEDWHGASQRYLWPCGVENVLIIDDKEGQKMRLMDLEHKCDRLSEAESREQGTNFLYCNGDITNWPGNLHNLRANS
jgi:ribosomal protein L11 methylase PrmA